MKNHILAFIIIITLGLTSSACADQQQQYSMTATYPVKPSNTPQLATIVPKDTAEPAFFPLAEPGPYHAGNQEYSIVDESHNGREIKLLIWYPALKQMDADGHLIVRDAAPDTSSAPYPLILTEENSGRYFFLSHLASHGFVMVVVRSPKSIQGEPLGEFPLIDNVRDFLFALDQIASNPPEGLEGVIDSDHAGVTGYSYGGDISLTISGARIDPEFYRSQCEQLPEIVPPSFQWVYLKWYCLDANNWDDFVSYVGEEITTSDDGLWQPITDARIRAVMPMAPTVSWYFGKRGLDAVDHPTLLIWGTKDVDSPYPLEAAYTYENLGSPERFLISFIGRTHNLPQMDEAAARVNHFATAFFGTYLQGREDYRKYFSEDFVAQFDDLAWGVYTGK